MANVVPGAIAALHRAADAGAWDEVDARQAEVLAARGALGPGGTARATKRAVAEHRVRYGVLPVEPPDRPLAR